MPYSIKFFDGEPGIVVDPDGDYATRHDARIKLAEIAGNREPKKRGGRRSGSGRPNRGTPSTRHNILIDDAVWAWLKDQPGGAGPAIERLVKLSQASDER